MRSFVAFIPEIIFERPLTIKQKVSQNLFFLPGSHKHSQEIRSDIETAGYNISGGAYLYFKGEFKNDITSYEIFYGYCLALTFFYYINGRVSCRAVKELEVGEGVKLYIDKFDKFGVDPDDIITLKLEHRKKIDNFYLQVITHLGIKDFNPFRNTLEFFALFSKEYEIRIRLLYLSICLESLFLEGNDNEGVGHKLGLRCAALISHFDKQALASSTFVEVRTGYNLRSKIIHGANYQKESREVINKKRSKATRESDHVDILEDILKTIIHFLLKNKEFYEAACNKTLGAKIDQELIVEKI